MAQKCISLLIIILFSFFFFGGEIELDAISVFRCSFRATLPVARARCEWKWNRGALSISFSFHRRGLLQVAVVADVVASAAATDFAAAAATDVAAAILKV